ncbi:MAG: hypothetical protein U0936_16750 [Planctomycetaceae bacterium]
MSRVTAANCREASLREWLVALVIGCGLSLYVWRGFLSGGGLVGGDTYPYFFPQKQVLAESFARGEMPLWHDRTSLGYPLLAESQAGVFYPTNQIFYRLLDIHSAYHASIILHYAAAFVFAWRFCRSQKLSSSSALLAAMVFVYGWFPVRVSLEWSIIGGVWFPFCLWMTERFLQKPNRRRLACLALSFAVHLLAGHYTLAFIAQLTCLGFAFLSSPRQRLANESTAQPAESAQADFFSTLVLGRWRAAASVTAAIAMAVSLAAVQLLPTHELRQLSQRDGTHAVFNPADGHMPPMYLTQLVASWWYWHTPEMAVSRESLKHPFLLSAGDTNPVEAHLYVGLIPLLLMMSLLSTPVRRFVRATNWKTWGTLAVAGILYAFGWFVPIFRHLPGFGFFIGPGRYTIITTLGFAIIAGLGLDGLLRRRGTATKIVLTTLIGMMTLPDLLKSAEYPVCDAQVVEFPPLKGLKESWLAKLLQEEDARAPVRLLSGGPNIANLFGVSSVPQYLGLGPAEYFSKELAVETQPQSADSVFPSAEQLQRLNSLGVTHILTTEPVQKLAENCELIGSGPDAFLNRVWGRGTADCFLYRMKHSSGRVAVEPTAALSQLSFLRRSSGNVEFEVELRDAAEVHLVELMFPGWNVTVDGTSFEPSQSSGIRRSIRVDAGKHVIHWQYQPRSFQLGTTVSLLSAALLATGCLRRRGPPQSTKTE